MYYRNALIGCLEKGGFSSLYAGWGAVLCRNIPHSIIKVPFIVSVSCYGHYFIIYTLFIIFQFVFTLISQNYST